MTTKALTAAGCCLVCLLGVTACDGPDSSPVSDSDTAAKSAVLGGVVWQVAAIGGKTASVAPVSAINLTFDTQAERVAGSDSCNQFTGAARFRSGGHLALGPIAVTKRLCPDIPTPHDFYATLEAVRAYQLRDDVLLLLDGQGRTQVTLSQPSPP